MEILGSILAIVFTLFLCWCITRPKPVQYRPQHDQTHQPKLIVVNIPPPLTTENLSNQGQENEEKLKRCDKCHNLKTFGRWVSSTRGYYSAWVCSYCLADTKESEQAAHSKSEGHDEQYDKSK